MSILGTHIRQLREAARLSLQDVATMADLSKAHVWEIEMGNASNPTVRTICAIAVALDVDPSDLTTSAIRDCLADLKVETKLIKIVRR